MLPQPLHIKIGIGMLLPCLTLGGTMSACSSHLDEHLEGNENAATQREYQLVQARYTGQGEYAEHFDKLSEPYNTEMMERFDSHLEQKGQIVAAGPPISEPRYRAYTDGPRVAQYYARKKLFVDPSSGEVQEPMSGRRLAQSDPFVTQNPQSSTNCTQDNLCDETDGIRHNFATYALLQGIGTLGNPVTPVFYRPHIDSDQVALNPNAQPDMVLAQYFDYGRLEYRNGQITLAEIGYEVLLADEVNRSPETAFMDSGFFEVDGEPLEAGHPLRVARAEQHSQVPGVLATLRQEPGIRFALSIMAVGMAATLAPSPDPVTKGGGPSLLVVGGVILVGVTAALGLAYLWAMLPQPDSLAEIYGLNHAMASSYPDVTPLPANEQGLPRGAYSKEGKNDAVDWFLNEIVEASFAAGVWQMRPHVCMAWTSTNDRSALGVFATNLLTSQNVLQHPGLGILFAFGVGPTHETARLNARNNLWAIRNDLLVEIVQFTVPMIWETHYQCYHPR